MSVSRRLRYEILRRDGHKCRYCGAGAPDAKLTVDHVIPVALGGCDESTNLVTACKDCNAGKSSSSPDQSLVDNVAEDALRWAAAMRRAAEIQASEREQRVAYLAAFDAEWSSWGVGTGDERRLIERDAGWQNSVGRWYDLGVEVEVLTDLLPSTMTAKGVSDWNRWRYFCGAAWKVVKARQELAADLLAQEELEQRAAVEAEQQEDERRDYLEDIANEERSIEQPFVGTYPLESDPAWLG